MEGFFIGFLSMFLVIGAFLLFGVGIFISIIWITLAFASLYHAVSMSEEKFG